MEQYGNHHIQEIPLSSPFFHDKVDRFLRANGLRPEALDSYYAICHPSGEIIAGAGVHRDIIKCVAVSAEARCEGLVAPLVSHILSQNPAAGYKVFTKPEYEAVFASLGFRLLARAPLAILMENGRGAERYCQELSRLRSRGRAGVAVMNANPFTLGHRHLLEQALGQVDTLYVIPVKEEASLFPYAERKTMLACGAPEGTVVLDGSPYQISAATFPTYFLKELSDAAETQMRLDLDFFSRHIVPALGLSCRFVGSEPSDPLTARYNALMKELLPVPVVEIPRLEDESGAPISASRVREALGKGSYSRAQALCPASDAPYLLGELAHRALLRELDTPGKPGLVGPDGPGAHTDMDYALMHRAILALRPYWSRMALAPSVEALRQCGLEAEEAMLEATSGVNTHRGAIFSLGIALFARVRSGSDAVKLSALIGETARAMDRRGVLPRDGVKGAREMAEGGYKVLFSDWLPHLDSYPETLLRIISSLEDTCVLKRVGSERARAVRQEAKTLLERYSEEGLARMCAAYASEGISPGGAADMLALTIFIDSILK